LWKILLFDSLDQPVNCTRHLPLGVHSRIEVFGVIANFRFVHSSCTNCRWQNRWVVGDVEIRRVAQCRSLNFSPRTSHSPSLENQETRRSLEDPAAQSVPQACESVADWLIRRNSSGIFARPMSGRQEAVIHL
jgi:hypothetical protein